MTEAHLSPQAYERLRQELEERSTTRRREISLWIERAREHGDIKENADYDAAKNEQGLNEARVRQLEAMLREITDFALILEEFYQTTGFSKLQKVFQDLPGGSL
jgi:DNA-binding protein H-NS